MREELGYKGSVTGEEGLGKSKEGGRKQEEEKGKEESYDIK